MIASEIINQIANSREYKDLCRNITKGNPLHEDLFQELILTLCEKDPAKIEDLHGKGELKWFIIKILQNQYKSTSSKFYKQNIQFSQRSSELNDEPEKDNQEDELNDIIQVVEAEAKKETFEKSSEWYENKLFRSYLKETSLRKLERKTDISRNAITNTILQYVGKLKDKVETKRKFMEKRFIKLELPKNLKEDIFENSLYENMKPEELIIQHLKKINKTIKVKRSTTITITQITIF